MEIRLFATLRENRGKTVNVDWAEGMDGHALLKALNITREEVAIFLVNGTNSKPDTLIKAGDVIALFPPVGGG